MVPETDLYRRWERLQDGAAIGSTLVHVAHEGSMQDLDEALHALSRSHLEAACLALALLRAQNATPDDPPHPPEGGAVEAVDDVRFGLTPRRGCTSAPRGRKTEPHRVRDS